MKRRLRRAIHEKRGPLGPPSQASHLLPLLRLERELRYQSDAARVAGKHRAGIVEVRIARRKVTLVARTHRIERSYVADSQSLSGIASRNQLGMVDDVVEFCAESELHPFRDRKILEHAEVKVVGRLGCQRIAPAVGERAGSSQDVTGIRIGCQIPYNEWTRIKLGIRIAIAEVPGGQVAVAQVNHTTSGASSSTWIEDRPISRGVSVQV